MFEKNDRTLLVARRIVNIVLFILMCACVFAGIILIISSFCSYVDEDGYLINYINWGMLLGGAGTMIAGPVVLQFVWLAFDIKFNCLLDVKIIRNVKCGIDEPKLPSPLFHGKKTCERLVVADPYEKLRQYKELLDAGVLTEKEFEDIKSGLLNKNATENQTFDRDIEKVKKLKAYADEKILTEEEFLAEKSKILKN